MDYSKMTQDEFDNILNDIVNDQNDHPSSLMSIPGIYEILSEYYNNDVLYEWAARKQFDGDL